MRRPIVRLTGAAALLAVAVAVSITLTPSRLPGDQPPGASPPGAANTPGATPLATLPPASNPVESPPGGGGGTARPVDLLPVSNVEAAALQAAVDRAQAAFGLGAVAVGISADATVGWSGAAGRPRDGVTPLSGATPFAIASTTKTFTAAIVLQLVEEGRVRLDAPVTDYLPELTLAEGVTVEELLSHTSGIADLLAPMRDRLNAEPSRVWTPAEVLAVIGPSAFPPGTGWGYSNTNFLIAGMLVERVTDNAFADELARRITGPLELTGTGFPPAVAKENLLGISWSSAFWTAAALDSTADDLVRWGDALYGGAILRPSSLERMLTFNDRAYGLGAERYSLAGLAGYGHSGLLRSFTTLLIRLPTAQLTIAVLATGHSFSPSALLTYAGGGEPSILDLARAISPG
ncbi:MAG: serine hydrolase [Chloroflexi bacterium]|nr:serine hydrolase [Chloroflexota bacterium]